MKLLTVSLVLLMAFNAQAKNSEAKVCERLYKQAEDSCGVTICEDYVNETEEECVIDGDFMVAVQVCADDEMPHYISAYNQKNPTKKVSCKE